MVKVKRTLVQALRLCTDRTAHRGIRGIALLFLDHGTRRGSGVSVTPRPLFTTGKTFYRRLGGPQGQSGWAKNLASHRDSISRTIQPVALQYRLIYPADLSQVTANKRTLKYVDEASAI